MTPEQALRDACVRIKARADRAERRGDNTRLDVVERARCYGMALGLISALEIFEPAMIDADILTPEED